MIRLTFITNNMRCDAEEFDTDDLGEALAEHGRKHFGAGRNGGPETWVFALVVERGDARMDRATIIDKLDDMVQIELARAARA